ncbi:TetR family transcriptional regulator [Rhodobacterales bacterium 52_120_T64]|nr:TetR family transcriptional regulator [Rhodobacterales bacterium 52_120_T64]
MARKSGSSGIKTAKQLHETATVLFAKNGYAAVSMRQIAREVGVQAGALYLYTADKQSLLFDLLDEHMKDLLDAWEGRTTPHEITPIDQLERFVRFHIRFHLPRADEVFISYMELRNLTPENFEVIQNARRTYEAILHDILSAGQTDGTFKVSDTKVATYAIIAMLTGMNTWYRDEGRLSLDMIEEIYLDLVLSAAGATP